MFIDHTYLFGCMAWWVRICVLTLAYYKQRVAMYTNINYNVHSKAPKDYLIINSRAA
jgi:hypothetical protein